MEEKLLDTVEAAAFLDLSRESVSYFVHTGKLPSQKFGRARLIRESDLIAFKAIDRKPGRPPKAKDATTDEPAVNEADEPATKPMKDKSAKAKKAAKKTAAPKIASVKAISKVSAKKAD